MNKLFFVFLLFVVISGYAQKSRTYYTKRNEITDVEHSYFYKVGIREADKYIDTVLSYYTEGDKIRSQEEYNAKGNRIGIYKEFYENGNIKIKGNYSDGQRSGIFMYWHESGDPYMSLEFPLGDTRISQWEDINYKITNYWDSLGNQVVRDGDGFCDGYIDVGYDRERIHERGRVKRGLRDSVWVGTINNNVVTQEVYLKGEFVKGVRFDSGKEVVYVNIETMAQYKGGLEALAKFLKNEVKYPKDARKRGIQGTVFTTFIVEQDGLISNVKIVKTIYPSLDEEAIRVLSTMKWEPATYRGKIVRSRYVFPLKFKLAS